MISFTSAGVAPRAERGVAFRNVFGQSGEVGSVTEFLQCVLRLFAFDGLLFFGVAFVDEDEAVFDPEGNCHGFFHPVIFCLNIVFGYMDVANDFLVVEDTHGEFVGDFLMPFVIGHAARGECLIKFYPIVVESVADDFIDFILNRLRREGEAETFGFLLKKGFFDEGFAAFEMKLLNSLCQLLAFKLLK